MSDTPRTDAFSASRTPIYVIGNAVRDRMIDYAEFARTLERELTAARAEHTMMIAELRAAQKLIDELRAECEQLRAEAERYRWLRKFNRTGAIEVHVFNGHRTKGEYMEDLDAAIDAAMAPEGETR